METEIRNSLPEDLLHKSDFSDNLVYAKFALRFVAFILDFIIFFVAWVFFFLAASVTLNSLAMGSEGIAREMIGSFVISALYFPLMESSAWQATVGKKMLGIKVATVYGERIGFGRAFGRLLSRPLSQFFLCAGYIMAAFTE